MKKEFETPLEDLLAKMTDERVARLHRIVRSRMKGLTVVLESLYDPGNRSAIYRSAEAFGLRDVHVIKPESAFKPHARSVSKGAEKWIDIHNWDEPVACVKHLQSQGFSVIAADLQAARPLNTLDFTKPVALVFGSELEGISEEMRAACDGTFLIPMAGFTVSFNVSVAAAIALQHARSERERALGGMTDLSPQEADAMLQDFARRSSRWLHRVQGRGRGKDERATWKDAQAAGTLSASAAPEDD